MAGAALFAVFYFSPLAELVIVRLERDYPPLLHPGTPSQQKAVVVLSGYGEDHSLIPVTSRLTEQTICRLVEGIRLYRLLPGSRIILSGGILRDGDKPVAEIMSDFVKEMGIPAEDITAEGASLNTYENLREVKRIIGINPFILVTSACDLRRAMAVARKLNMNPVAAPAGIWSAHHYPPDLTWSEWLRRVLGAFAHPSAQRLTYLQWAHHEYVGYIWYKLLGRI
jgi:uncharacterized SAM-binding protein YcdF (DUF218 family)